MCLATIAYPVRVTICNTSGKFQPVLNFTWSHALTLVAHSYALLGFIYSDNNCLLCQGWNDFRDTVEQVSAEVQPL